MELQVIVPNLARRPDRKYASMGALCTRGIRRDHITYFEAHDAMRYGTDVERFFNDVRADGFDFFDEYASKAAENNYHRVKLGYWATQWSILSCFRHIADQADPYVFLLDDYYITINYGQLKFLLRELIVLEKMRLLQLDHYLIQATQPRKPRLLHPHSFISKRLLGCGECALAMTPEGAQYLLDNCPLPAYNYEMMFYRMDEHTPGFFSCAQPIASRFPDCPNDTQNSKDWKNTYGHEFGW